MELLIHTGARQTCRSAWKRRAFHTSHQCRATPTGEIKPAPAIRFTGDSNQFARSQPRAQLIQEEEQDAPSSLGRRRGRNDSSLDPEQRRLLRRIRLVPASPSYFTALPKHMDDVLHISSLLRKYQLLPTASPEEVARVTFKKRRDYQIETQEPVRSKSYGIMVSLLRRLSLIHPSLIPEEVTQTLEKYKRLVQPYLNKAKPIIIDEFGRAKALGRRKSSRAAVYLVEGDGQVLINGRSLTEYFARLHDRESAVWALKATQRLDKYNVWGIVHGGGTTGQAEALTLAVSKALLAHEPDLKPALRRAGVVTRDPRRVERKKPGKLKARKMPTWVKR
ncbi:37S ribosomal S9, mitochondrial [Lecanosticta acicola]|uniref:Small ribosomal subunit protein uS9m n=1 Tax=Lecanosticta acicola TaxID=111012 RepID=A0AAI9E9U5_9PEZI|nr:37S ribosomal S9, mitochondrial [Lecanosticta acicola]